MAQDDRGQSHGDSCNNPPVSAPTSTSPSLAPIVVPVTAPPASVASTGSVNTTAVADTILPPITTIASAPFTAADRPTASTNTAAPTAPTPAESDSAAVLSFPAPTPSTASAPAASASAAPPVASQQNGDSRASEAASAPVSKPEMSNQHPGMPHGQPVSYPGSTHYAHSIGATTAQYGSYPAVTSQPPDPYRPSPMSIGSNMSLPSMRTIENPHGPPVSSPQGMQMNMPMAPVPNNMPYYGHQGIPMGAGYAISDPMAARYALPHDPRLLGPRGPKKCDETHPTCNNCKKSKRECMGYDPIFRQQAGGQSSSNIQPAPSQRTPPTVPSSVPSIVPSSIASSSNLTARPTNSYGSQPSMLPSSYGAVHATTASPNPSITSLSYDSSFSNVASPPVKSEPTYEYPPAIDPALQGFSSASHAESSRAVDQRHLADNQNLRGGAPYY
ncbi:hypothetical protein ACHAPU_001601 [Fusarium lateritium]